jgi:hypothetical protein
MPQLRLEAQQFIISETMLTQCIIDWLFCKYFLGYNVNFNQLYVMFIKDKQTTGIYFVYFQLKFQCLNSLALCES